MLRLRSATFTLLLILQFVIGSWAQTCESPDMKCDFVCDCSECSDEQDCGYRGKEFQCDFEDSGMCGWMDKSSNQPEYMWERRQRGNTLSDSGPSSDYTTGTATGWYMGVTAVKSESPSTARLVSPLMKDSAPTCRLHLRYFLWDSGNTGMSSTVLWASVLHQDSRQAIVWRPEANSARGWREDTIFLGRIPETFQVHFHSQRSEGRLGDVALDQLEFLDCALPLPPSSEGCPSSMMECGREGCVDKRQVCDGTDDCGDGTDEQNCTFSRCDFEDGLCDWDLSSLSTLKWVRTNQNNISINDPLQGPGRDHSTNSMTGHFLYVTMPDDGLTMDWAAFQSPPLEPTNSSHPCKMVMYTHQFGPRSGGLTVLVADGRIYPVWKRGGALGDVWVKAEVEIVTSSIFQIVIMAAIKDFPYGGVAIDSIVLSPECRKSSGNITLAEHPEPPKDLCTAREKICDFKRDCDNGDDEAKCGDFSYPEGSSGWTDTSIGSQGWVLHKNSTAKEEYLYVVKAPGQQLTEAETRTPFMGPTGPACTMSFAFALTGNPSHIGKLSARVFDSLHGIQPTMWEYSGKTGRDPESWHNVSLTIGVRKHRFQVAFEARASRLCPCVRIRVKDVRFINCHADYFPHSPTALSCNFENGLCGWYQDNDDNFDWAHLEGMDHTIGIGRSLVVDMWSPSLRGSLGRLISFTQSPGPSEYCLSFFYKLYGPNAGALNVKISDQTGHQNLLWTRSGAQGNIWHEVHCPVPHQLANFKLIFEAVRSGFDGRVAIDDVAFVEKPCSMPRICSFEGNRCGYDSFGRIQWLYRSGSTTSKTGPKTDHTLETDLGFYMMVNTGADILPNGGTANLISPVRQGTTKKECVLFWYQMGGMNPGSLTLYMKPLKGARVKIFSDNLNQGGIWRHGSGNVSPGLQDWQLEFEVVGAGGEDSYVAIDDIILSAHPCQGSKCTLERGMCSWSNTRDLQKDKLEWELTNPESEKHYPIPQEDHTLGTERGHFLFLPSSSRTPANENARLLSPHLPPTKGTCLRFWAYKPSSSDSALRVLRLSESGDDELLAVRNLEAPWRRFNVNIISSKEYQIGFEGIKGQSGVIALDDIEYTLGTNCDKEVTDHPPKEPDNTAGTAASITVMILLIGTLIGLLVFYLRTRPVDRAAPSSAPSSARAGFSNETYEPDRVTVPSMQNHPMAAGFNNVSISADVKENSEA